MEIIKLTKSLNCYVVENHNEVLEPLYRQIGSKKLPYEGMFMLHFDSHADMSVPKDLSTCEDGMLSKHDVFRYSCIESWIIPVLYSGHVDHVMWMYPYWTKHSFLEEDSFKVGRLADNSLRVTSSSNHFLSEDNYEHEELLRDCKKIKLGVNKFDPATLEHLGTVNKIREEIRLRGGVFILDVDLDFFSTKDPFLDMLKPEQYEFLKDKYKFEVPTGDEDESIRKCLQRRRSQLKNMKDYFNLLSEIDRLNNGDAAIDMWKDNNSSSQDIDWLWLHEIGSGIDDCELPHHVSSSEEVDRLVSGMEVFLGKLPAPSMVLVARSSEDDYCPADQVDIIQAKVINMLRRLYSNA